MSDRDSEQVFKELDLLRQLVEGNARALQTYVQSAAKEREEDAKRREQEALERQKEREEDAKRREQEALERQKEREEDAKRREQEALERQKEREEDAKERQELRQLMQSTIRSMEAYADKAADERLELRQLIEANARGLQAHADSSMADRAQIKEAILMLTNVQRDMANMLGILNEDRAIIIRKLMAIDSKLDLLLENQNDESNS